MRTVRRPGVAHGIGVTIIFLIASVLNLEATNKWLMAEKELSDRCFHPQIEVQTFDGTGTGTHSRGNGLEEIIFSLNLRGCGLTSLEKLLPYLSADIAKATSVNISENYLNPKELSKLSHYFPIIKILVVANSLIQLGRWPKSAPLPPTLRNFIANNSGLKSIDEGVLPESLEWLVLTNNELKALPSSGMQGQYGKSLIKVSLSSNQLSILPNGLEKWTRLELLRIGGGKNKIRELPESLWKLPRLAYLGLGSANSPLGTDASLALEGLSLRDVLSLSDDEVGHDNVIRRLGSGASGTSFLVRLHLDDHVEAISAVAKIFHSVSGTDGDTADEIAVHRVVVHPNIVKLLGVLSSDPSTLRGDNTGRDLNV